MRCVLSIILVLFVGFLCFGCAIEQDTGYLPDYTVITFSSFDSLFDFLESGKINQKSVMRNMGFSSDQMASMLDFSEKINNRSIPIINTLDTPESIEIRSIYGTIDPHISIKYREYSYTVFFPSVTHIGDIQKGDLEGYYQKAHPTFNRPNSYSEQDYLAIKFLKLNRTDMDSEAIIFIPQISAPYIEFIRDGIIVRITHFDNYGSLNQDKLIGLANEIIIEDVSLK